MNEIVEFIAKHKVVVICRGLYDNELIKTIRALYDGGIRVVEVTFDQADPDAVEKTCGAIRTIKEHFPQMKVGSGTVTCVKHVLATKEAGGEFCLSPDVNTEVIRATKGSRSDFYTRSNDLNRNFAGTQCRSGYRENIPCRMAGTVLSEGYQRADQSCEIPCGSRCK